MKRKICLCIMCLMLFTGCGNNLSKVSNSLSQKFNDNLVATNTYQENTLTYTAAKDVDGNYYRFTIDGQNRVIFAESYDKYKEDIELKKEISKYLQDNYLLYVQYNTNDLEKCDIYLYTDYIIDLGELTKNLKQIPDLDVNKITYHTATVDTKENLNKFEKIINKNLKEYGTFNKTVEEDLLLHVRDYTLTSVSGEW